MRRGRFSGRRASPWIQKETCTWWMVCGAPYKFSIAKVICCITSGNGGRPPGSFNYQQDSLSTGMTGFMWRTRQTAGCRFITILRCRSKLLGEPCEEGVVDLCGLAACGSDDAGPADWWRSLGHARSDAEWKLVD